MIAAETIPAELRRLRCWHAHIDKSPRDATGMPLDKWQLPENCLTFDDAVARAKTLKGNLVGVGIAYAASGAIRGLDLDGPRDPVSGVVHPDAQSIITGVNSYTEISPSQTGFRILFKAEAERADKWERTDVQWTHATPGKKAKIEVFVGKGFCTITGDHLPGTPTDIKDQPTTLGHPRIMRKQSTVARLGGFVLPDIIPQGQRDDTLFRLGCWLRGVCGLEQDAIVERLSEINAERCDPPLDEKTVRAKAVQAAQYPIGEKMDDIANAERLVQRHGDRLRYVKSHRAWYVWDGRCWVRDDRDHVVECAKDVARSFYADAADQPDDKIRKALFGHASRSAARPKIDAMVALARSDPRMAMTGKEFDADPMVLNVANGTLDLRSGTLRRHDRDDLLTKLAPVRYKPDATAPRWLAFLDRIMGGNQELIAYLQRAVGYALTGDTREECVFFCFGTGANGKSKFLETLRALLGDYAMDTNFATFLDAHRGAGAASPDLARLRGARFVTAVEAPAGRAFNEAVLKKAVGGDMMVARQLYQEEQEFLPQFKIWFAANHKPQVREQTEAFWRRMRLVPFAITIPLAERDKGLLAALKKELPGILNWALEGCRQWQLHGLNAPAAVTGATDAYREENDEVGDYLAVRCDLEPRVWTSSSALYKDFSAWYRSTYGEHVRPVSNRRFGQLLEERPGLTSRKRNGVRGWLGVALKPVPADKGQVTAEAADTELPF
jgi:putative DNA primase/helicase